MKKILLVFGGIDFSEGAFEFARHLNIKSMKIFMTLYCHSDKARPKNYFSHKYKMCSGRILTGYFWGKRFIKTSCNFYRSLFPCIILCIMAISAIAGRIWMEPPALNAKTPTVHPIMRIPAITYSMFPINLIYYDQIKLLNAYVACNDLYPGLS